MATRKQIAAARKNIKKAHAANRRTHGRKSGGKKTGRRSACVGERWSGPCRSARNGKFRSC